MADLVTLLLSTGLLQFGRFGKDGAPLCLHLDLLPSYPDLLRQIADQSQAKLNELTVNRLVCMAEAIPFGIAVSLQTGLPLVYSRGTDAQPTFDLVGAYDIGHPAVLLANTTHNPEAISWLLTQARRVGLEVHTVLAIVEFRPPDSRLADPYVEVYSLLSLSSIIDNLTRRELLPPGQRQAILDWINRPRPDSEGP